MSIDRFFEDIFSKMESKLGYLNRDTEEDDLLNKTIVRRGERKSWLKTQHSKNLDHGIQSHCFTAN